MSDTTPAHAVEIPSAPLIAPDLSPATIDAAVTKLATGANPFIPPKVRAAIYTAGGLVTIAAVAIAPVIGGTIGGVIDLIGSASAALTSALALSHVAK